MKVKSNIKMQYKRALILQSQEGDWETLYIDGVKIDSGHTLNEGKDRGIYFMEIAQKHSLELHDFQIMKAPDNINKYANDYGEFPRYELMISMLMQDQK